jgi:hypothetical protein
MAISRQRALERLMKNAEVIESHLAKLRRDPGHPAAAHWRHEVRNWIAQMERMVPHVGKKTGAEWRLRIETFQSDLATSL